MLAGEWGAMGRRWVAQPVAHAAFSLPASSTASARVIVAEAAVGVPNHDVGNVGVGALSLNGVRSATRRSRAMLRDSRHRALERAVTGMHRAASMRGASPRYSGVAGFSPTQGSGPVLAALVLALLSQVLVLITTPPLQDPVNVQEEADMTGNKRKITIGCVSTLMVTTSVASNVVASSVMG